MSRPNRNGNGDPSADGEQSVMARLAAALEQQNQLMQQSNVQQKELADKNLARISAGPVPQFKGQRDSIEVHRWCIAMERWFDTARVTDDQEKLVIAAGALKEGAQAWYETEKKGGRIGGGDWNAFTVAIKKTFLPMDVERWTLHELNALTQRRHADVQEYTTKFHELAQLLPAAHSELARIVQYEAGLPEKYSVDCAQKKHNTLSAAMEATVAKWNAEGITRSYAKGTASLHQMESEGDGSSASSARSPGTGGTPLGWGATPTTGPHTVSNQTEQLIAQLAAVRAELDEYRRTGGSGSGNRGYRSRRGSFRGRGAGPRRGGGSRSGSPRRTPGISDELARSRIEEGKCIRCGQGDHFARECPNAVSAADPK